MPDELVIPAEILPADGRFGSGPSKVRAEQVEAIVAANPSVLGTSHRQAPVKNLVGDVRRMIAELYALPDGYEVLLGNGGSTLFWDAAAFSLVETRSQHCVFGEFGGKFAQATADAPHLLAPSVIEAAAGSLATPKAEQGVDLYAWPHNETSTGVAAPVVRPAGTGDALVVVDGTSAAGGIELDASQTDVYYFAPQKSFAADGGIWFALVSPAALARIEAIAASGRYVPQSLDLATAVENSRVDQTLNTPAVATLLLMRAQLEWMLAGGGLAAMAARSARSTGMLYDWAEASDYASPFVAIPEQRSPVVATIDLDEAVDSERLQRILRAHGVVDVFPYRKLGRNQLRVGCFPAVEPEDVERLIASIDWVVAHW
jgi:phosphoserine aminotransferase